MLSLGCTRIFVAALLGTAALTHAQDTATYRTPSAALAAIVDAPLPPTAAVSPDRATLLLLSRPDAPSLAELAQPELRLAGLRVNPATNGPSRSTYYTGLTLKPIGGGDERRVTGLPEGARIADYEWSRDGRKIALTLVTGKGIELWLVDAKAATARRLTGPILNAVFGEPLVWLDATTMIIRRVPGQRDLPPVAPSVPAGPVVQENSGRRASARTYDGLLTNAHDEALFAYYGTSELALVSLDGKLTPLPVRGMVTVVNPSPDGQHMVVQTLQRPFSYLVTYSRFPTTIDVHDRTGKREHRVASLPLWEGTGEGSVRPGPRSVTWRADAPATLSWTQSAARNTKTRDDKTARDLWFTHAAPFAAKPTEQQRFEHRLSGVQWSTDDFALVTESQTATRMVRTYQVAPGRPGSAPTLLFARNSDDRYGDPGRAETTRNALGRVVLQRSADGTKLYLSGAGASPEGDRPFLDEFDLNTKKSRRLWRSAPPDYEQFVSFLDDSLQRAVVVRESPAAPTNYFVRDFAHGTLTALTAFPNPYPQFQHVKHEVVRYKRADGVGLSGTLSLPPGWTPAQGPLPTLLWAYPREFLSAETAEQVKATPERFSRVSAQGPLPFVLAGYAVLNDPAMPIIGQDGKKPNDTYIEQLVASAKAAVDELVRRGVADPERIAVGGHSYGAFMTANLLAHSRLFRAGIARSGAYNRTLTPFGFQREQRTLWQAPEVYAAMSPFNYAQNIKDPILLLHGAADNNSGTFPMQSERFYNALKAHGATTRLVILPHESHGYRARESVMHMLWEMETWLDKHVKSPAKAAAKTSE